MKFWRTLAVASVALLAAATAFAAMAPKAPAAAGPAISCTKVTDLTLVFPMVMCVEMMEATSTNVGNGFPWTNDTLDFATFRNQILYPSSTVDNVASETLLMEGIHARAVTFSAAATNVYGSFLNGADSYVRITDAVSDSIVRTFSANTGAPVAACSLTGNSGSPIQIGTTTGPNGSMLSNCDSCADNRWCIPGDVTPGSRAFQRLLFDQTMAVQGGSGFGIWDMTRAFCPEVQRAYGSGSFINSQHLTTAYNLDTAGIAWVFHGVAPPPPATVEQQIKEIVRLLLTPEGLRCSGLDLNPGNGIIEDDPIMYPMGQFVDPIQPQVTTGGTVTGDELVDALRKHGWKP